MIFIKNFSAGYENFSVVHDVTMRLSAGKVSVLMGPNGAGKSTFIRSIFNLNRIRSGKILFGSENISGVPPWSLLKLGIAYVPQGGINFQTMTVRENILVGAYTLASRQVIERNYEYVLNHFPALKKFEHRYVYTLSGGEAQMLALARALMMRPKVMLLDEPSMGLSPMLVKQTFTLLREIQREYQMTLLIVEHNLKSVLNIADWVFVMVQGRLVADGPADEFRHSAIMEKVYFGELE